MKYKFLVAILFATYQLLTTPIAEAQEIPGIHWHTSTREAFAEAKATNKPVMMDIYADWCGYCKALDKDTFPDPKVKAIAQKMICLRLNSERPAGASWARTFKIHGYPTILFFSPEKEEIHRTSGYMNAADFTGEMVEALMKYNSYLSHRPDAKIVVPDAIWKILLVTIPETNVTVTRNDKKETLHETISRQDIDCAKKSYSQFPLLVAKLTQNRVKIEAKMITLKETISQVTALGADFHYPSAEDVYSHIKSYDESGEYDCILINWKGSSLMGSWGTAGKKTRKGSLYLVVRDADEKAWSEDNNGEIFLHLWIRGIASDFREMGYSDQIPPNDAAGGESNGYSGSRGGGWRSYYWPLLNGLVPVNGVMKGFTSEMWKRGAPRHRNPKTQDQVKIEISKT